MLVCVTITFACSARHSKGAKVPLTTKRNLASLMLYWLTFRVLFLASIRRSSLGTKKVRTEATAIHRLLHTTNNLSFPSIQRFRSRVKLSEGHYQPLLECGHFENKVQDRPHIERIGEGETKRKVEARGGEGGGGGIDIVYIYTSRILPSSQHFEALEFFRDVFQGKDTRALDPLYWYDPKFNNGEILDACENFILTLENVGLRSEAETQRYAIIDFFERNQGPGDLFTLGTLYDLTMYKSDKGGTNSYIENLERIVRGYELILGRDHEVSTGSEEGARSEATTIYCATI